jgi:hypothetical protein
MMDVMGEPRPRRRRRPTRGLLFGAPLDRMVAVAEPASGVASPRRPDHPLPIALIGESTPVAPPRVVPFGAMAATWPLAERSREAAAPGDQITTAVDALTAASSSSFASVVLPDRRQHASRPADGLERRWGGLSAPEWQHLLGR